MASNRVEMLRIIAQSDLGFTEKDLLLEVNKQIEKFDFDYREEITPLNCVQRLIYGGYVEKIEIDDQEYYRMIK